MKQRPLGIKTNFRRFIAAKATPASVGMTACCRRCESHLSLEADNLRTKLRELSGNLIGSGDDVCGGEGGDAFRALAELKGGQGLLRLRFLRAAADYQHRAERSGVI